jgi:hypothetical protein
VFVSTTGFGGKGNKDIRVVNVGFKQGFKDK